MMNELKFWWTNFNLNPSSRLKKIQQGNMGSDSIESKQFLESTDPTFP